MVLWKKQDCDGSVKIIEQKKNFWPRGIGIMRIERDCFELAEVAEAWGITDAEIRYLVANGTLKLSVRLVAQLVRLSYLEEGQDGASFWVPFEEKIFNGVADLSLRDAFRLVRDGETVVTDVFLPDNICVGLRGGEGLLLSHTDALVRREHAAMVEQSVLNQGAPRGKDAFDFRQFVVDGEEFAFTFQQARALEFMLNAARAGAPDQHYLDILNAAGSASQRLGSLFSRKPSWTRLMLKTSGRRGWYYLDPAFVVWLTRSA
jgi:hypothetical protein